MFVLYGQALSIAITLLVCIKLLRGVTQKIGNDAKGNGNVEGAFVALHWNPNAAFASCKQVRVYARDLVANDEQDGALGV